VQVCNLQIPPSESMGNICELKDVDNNKEFYLLRYNAMQSAESQLTIMRNIPPQPFRVEE
jgi:hypothetical protein